MKKNVLALSITAALVGFGFAGSAQAIALATGSIPVTSTADDFSVTSSGIGQFLLVPYYSAQGSNNTMINIVNTDTTNGKAVKVRFRGAANSDDVFDFQVFLSPGDKWSASVTRDVAGNTNLVTSDLSCTKPDKAVLNVTPFSTVRLDPARTGDALLNEAREGYVEIFNMADIPPKSGTNADLFTHIKHVAGSPNTAPPCRTKPTAVWTNLDDDTNLDNTGEALAAGLSAPTTGLFANWIILNAADAGSWSGAATALNATEQGVPAAGNIVYFPQTDKALAVGSVTNFTADPVLRSGFTKLASYDLPDFSTPYIGTAVTSPADQAEFLTRAIATTAIINEYLTPTAISAETDWVLSMPTRRYSVAYDYLSTATNKVVTTTLATPYFSYDVLDTTNLRTNVKVIDRQICITGTNIVLWDEEETTPAPGTDGVIVSPQKPGDTVSFDVCGEASVLSFNNGEKKSASGLITSSSGALKASVARSAIDAKDYEIYKSGWAQLNTPGLAGRGLPVLGYEAVKALGNATQAFGATLPHRTVSTIRTNP